MSIIVTKDPADPAFPHGEPRGYTRGCKCEPCLAAAARYKNRRRTLFALGHGAYYPAAPWKALVESWIAAGGTAIAISRASGLTPDVIYGLLREARPTVRRTTVDALGATTLDDVMAHLPERSLVSSATAMRQVRCLMAQGFTGRWIVEQVGGKTEQSNLAFVVQNRQQITVKMARDIDALARRVGNAQGPSTRTRSIAVKRGWWPLAAYDDLGNLDLRHYPGHPWAEADDMVGRLLDDLEWWAEHPAATPHEVSRRMGKEQSEATRLADRLKRLHGDRWHDALRGAVEAYGQGADGTLEALRAGLVLVGNVASAQVPKDHPAAEESRRGEGVSQAS